MIKIKKARTLRAHVQRASQKEKSARNLITIINKVEICAGTSGAREKSAQPVWTRHLHNVAGYNVYRMCAGLVGKMRLD